MLLMVIGIWLVNHFPFSFCMFALFFVIIVFRVLVIVVVMCIFTSDLYCG